MLPYEKSESPFRVVYPVVPLGPSVTRFVRCPVYEVLRGIHSIDFISLSLFVSYLIFNGSRPRPPQWQVILISKSIRFYLYNSSKWTRVVYCNTDINCHDTIYEFLHNYPIYSSIKKNLLIWLLLLLFIRSFSLDMSFHTYNWTTDLHIFWSIIHRVFKGFLSLDTRWVTEFSWLRPIQNQINLSTRFDPPLEHKPSQTLYYIEIFMKLRSRSLVWFLIKTVKFTRFPLYYLYFSSLFLIEIVLSGFTFPLCNSTFNFSFSCYFTTPFPLFLIFFRKFLCF